MFQGAIHTALYGIVGPRVHMPVRLHHAIAQHSHTAKPHLDQSSLLPTTLHTHTHNYPRHGILCQYRSPGLPQPQPILSTTKPHAQRPSSHNFPIAAALHPQTCIICGCHEPAGQLRHRGAQGPHMPLSCYPAHRSCSTQTRSPRFSHAISEGKIKLSARSCTVPTSSSHHTWQGVLSRCTLPDVEGVLSPCVNSLGVNRRPRPPLHQQTKPTRPTTPPGIPSKDFLPQTLHGSPLARRHNHLPTPTHVHRMPGEGRTGTRLTCNRLDAYTLSNAASPGPANRDLLHTLRAACSRHTSAYVTIGLDAGDPYAQQPCPSPRCTPPPPSHLHPAQTALQGCSTCRKVRFYRNASL